MIKRLRHEIQGAEARGHRDAASGQGRRVRGVAAGYVPVQAGRRVTCSPRRLTEGPRGETLDKGGLLCL